MAVYFFILRRKYILNNWINLDNLPRRDDGKINWKKCNHNLVRFCYNGYVGYFYVDEYYKDKNMRISYGGQSSTISISALKQLQLRKIKRMINIAEYLKQKENNTLDSVDVTFDDSEYCYGIGTILHLKKGDLLIRSYRVMFNKVKGYCVRWVGSDMEFAITETALQDSSNWNTGRFYKVVPGINDLWTVRPDVAELLSNPDDGYIYGQFTNKAVAFTCQNCHKHIGVKPISTVSLYGLSCCYCGDGVSYPNRLMSNLLHELNICFRREETFNWCIFPNYYNSDTWDYGKYDFVLHDLNLIIEMDGGIGHGNKPYSNSRYSQEELIYKDNMKDKLAIANGYHVIRIDCDYSNHEKFEFCRNNIIRSLSQYFDLSKVDWEKIQKESSSSILLKAVEMYNCGFEPMEISTKLERDYSTIVDYLHKGTELGMCEFIPQCA